jgi:hypothetical protein
MSQTLRLKTRFSLKYKGTMEPELSDDLRIYH